MKKNGPEVHPPYEETVTLATGSPLLLLPQFLSPPSVPEATIEQTAQKQLSQNETLRSGVSSHAQIEPQENIKKTP